METSKSSGNIRRRRRKRMNIFILNDDRNSFDYVMHVLMNIIPMCNSLQAEQIARLVGQKDCGCDARQKKLNKLFPYKNNKG